MEKDKVVVQTQISTTQGTPCNLKTLEVDLEDMYEDSRQYQQQFRNKSVRIISSDKKKIFDFERQGTNNEIEENEELELALDKHEEDNNNRNTLASEINVEVFDDDQFYRDHAKYNDDQFGFLSPKNNAQDSARKTQSFLETSQVNLLPSPKSNNQAKKIMVRVRNTASNQQETQKRATKSFLIVRKDEDKPNNSAKKEKPQAQKTQEEIDQEIRES